MKTLLILAPCLMGLWSVSVFAEDCISLKEIRSSHSKNMEKVDEPNKKHWVQKYLLDRAKISSAYTYGSVRSFVDGDGKTWRDGS